MIKTYFILGHTFFKRVRIYSSQSTGILNPLYLYTFFQKLKVFERFFFQLFIFRQIIFTQNNSTYTYYVISTKSFFSSLYPSSPTEVCIKFNYFNVITVPTYCKDSDCCIWILVNWPQINGYSIIYLPYKSL